MRYFLPQYIPTALCFSFFTTSFILFNLSLEVVSYCTSKIPRKDGEPHIRAEALSLI